MKIEKLMKVFNGGKFDKSSVKFNFLCRPENKFIKKNLGNTKRNYFFKCEVAKEGKKIRRVDGKNCDTEWLPKCAL